MVNFGALAAEIGLPVWGTPANFKGVFRVPTGQGKLEKVSEFE